MENHLFSIRINCRDAILRQHNLFRLNNFAYAVGGCLFNAMQTLLHFRYTSRDLCEGMIEHFRNCLNEQNAKAILSYDPELNIDALIQMHGVNNLNDYLERMKKSTSTLLWKGEDFGGHILYTLVIKLAKNSHKTLVKSIMKNYLIFNSNLNKES